VGMSVARSPKFVAASVLTALIAGVWAVPISRAHLKAMATLAEALGRPLPRPFAADVRAEEVELANGTAADMYSPGADAPAIVLVPGATRSGRDDPRVTRAARALARAGRRVLVPELELYGRTFESVDIDSIADAVAFVSNGPRDVVLVGFSYGGSLSLIAASRPDVEARLTAIGVFGAYYDLAHVIQAVTTEATIYDGKEIEFRVLPEARKVMREAAADLAPREHREPLAEALHDDDPAHLGPAPRAIFDLVRNDDPRRVDELIDRLPASYRRTLEDFSPAGRVSGLDVPVWVMQSTNDVATPATEALMLHDEIEESHLVLLRHFSHVDPTGVWGTFADGLRAWRFAGALMAAQE
jgi:pimeloyl-ACP methyl ester carboxylesterase